MDTDELESAYEEPRTPWKDRVARALRRRWVQVVLVLFGGALLMLLSGWLLKPKAEARAKDPRYLVCPKCEVETRYDSKLDGEPCPICTEDPPGVLVGRDESVKDVGRKSPWRWVHLAVSFEAILTVGGVVYLLYRPAADPSNTFYVFSCPHCVQRLRFRHVSLGGLGQCSRCKRPVRFPSIHEAVLEDDLIREEQERLTAEEEDEGEDE